MKYKIPPFTQLPSPLNNDFDLMHLRDNLSKQIKFYFKDYYAFVLILSGDILYNIEGKSYELKSGDIMLLSDTPALHIVNFNTIYERVIIWADRRYINSIGTNQLDLRSLFSKNILLRLNIEQIENIKYILKKIENEEILKNCGYTMMRKLYFTELLILVYRYFFNIENQSVEIDFYQDENVTQIVEYINNHLNEDLSLDSLSNKFNMNKYHLQREFKKNIGFTIYKFIQNKRLILASSLLKKNLSVTEVCFQCGFNDYSNFIRLFKNNFGVSPKKYSKLK